LDVTATQKRKGPAHLTRNNFYPNAQNNIFKPKEDDLLAAGRAGERSKGNSVQATPDL
jgi:hypothetical protein